MWSSGDPPPPSPAGRTAPVSAVGRLLGLLRAGEVSAAAGFGRIIADVTPSLGPPAAASLMRIGVDEARHERWLGALAGQLGLPAHRPSANVRRFFVRLASRESGIHLARISSLDGCVCQVLSHVLFAADNGLPPAVRSVIDGIRADEGRHVRVARRLARELGMDDARHATIDGETRAAFAAVLVDYEGAVAELAVDPFALARRISRSGSGP